MKVALLRLALLAAVTLALAVPAPAAAGPLVSSAADCPEETLEQPFRQWLDFARYTLVPDGGIEAGAAGWALDGAAPVAGNESFRVHDQDDATSLELQSGESATTPAICVGIEHPTLRLFARRSGGWLLSTLAVDVLFEDAGGVLRSVRIGAVLGGGSWQPTLPLPILVNLLPLLPGERTAVAFRFSAQGATWRIDDVYVDPYRRS